MKNFAFIVSPTNIMQLKKLWPAMRLLPSFMIKPLSKYLPHFKVLRVSGIRSKLGKSIDGSLIICPLLPWQLAVLGEELVLDRIISAGHLAMKVPARIVGLDCFAALIADKDYDTIARNLKMPVTSGHALTAWSIFEGVYRIAKAKKIDLKKSSLTITGAGSIALGLAARKMSDYVAKLTLVDKDKEQLGKLKELINANTSIEVNIEDNLQAAVKNADIVIEAGCMAEPAFNFDFKDLKPGAVFCHVPSFYNVLNRSGLREDITVIELGLIKLPFQEHLGVCLGLPRGIVYASVAETMLLTFEEKFVNYSLGDFINLDKLEEIADMAVRHGFEVWVPEAPVI